MTTRTRLWARLAAVAALLLLLGACAEKSPESLGEAPSATTMAPMDDMSDMSGDHDHEHETTEGVEWGSGSAPQVSVEVTGDPGSGWTVAVDVPGFTFTRAEENAPGQGHAHLIVDGQTLAMLFEPVGFIPELAPGAHEIEVALTSNDHRDYLAGGEVLSGSATVVVPGEVAAADATVEVTFAGGEVTIDDGRPKVSVGDLVEVTVTSDVVDEVHVHGYDVYHGVVPGEATVFRFEADAPGIWEVELEGAGALLFELVVS